MALPPMMLNLTALQQVLDSLPVPTFIKDAEHRFVFINRLASDYFDQPPQAMIGRRDADFFPAEQVRVFHEMDERVLDTGQVNENEETITDRNGVSRQVVTRKSLFVLGADRYLLVSISDITALRESEARARYLAYHDNLTGLPNRTALYERLNHLVGKPPQDDARMALLLVDLDGFKNVNDTYGHEAGDELLCSFGRRLKRVVPDAELVVRMGGDEFAVLVSSPPHADRVEQLCVLIVEAAAEAFHVVGVQSYIAASVGAFRINAGVTSPGEAVRKADTGLYEAKRRGKGRYCIYTPELDASLIRRKTVERELSATLAQGSGLNCVFQPLVEGSAGNLVGVEALARWESPTLGVIPPSQFIPIAEQAGLIAQLGEWILRQACREMRAWQQLFVAVNVSAIQLRNRSFAGNTLRILAEEDFPAARLELEITETAIIHVDELVTAQLQHLRAAGVRIAVDDFGTGYASLQLLKELKLDKIKIDQSFVSFMTQAKDSAAIVEAFTQLGGALGLQVVAEGVETVEQKQFLIDVGCTGFQGFLFSRPLDAASLLNILRDGAAPLAAH
ncbi:MAG TPA: EAL domain-containing protein [Oxalicibacterium sp.]|nr:EAL domain-containing protein [Oxalicibacterium sp.]